MKLTRHISAVLVALGIAVLGVSVAEAQGLEVKASGKKKFTLSDRVGKNQFVWVSTAPAEEIKGTAEGITGTVTFDPKKPQALKGTVSAQVATMKSGNDKRDEHLKSPMWLDGAKYPAITFTIASVKNLTFSKSEMKGNAVGKFTMHGVTKAMTIPFTLFYADASANTGQRAPGDLILLTADFTVSLKDFKVAGREGIIGSKVGETIKISAKLYGSSGL